MADEQDIPAPNKDRVAESTPASEGASDKLGEEARGDSNSQAGNDTIRALRDRGATDLARHNILPNLTVAEQPDSTIALPAPQASSNERFPTPPQDSGWQILGRGALGAKPPRLTQLTGPGANGEVRLAQATDAPGKRIEPTQAIKPGDKPSDKPSDKPIYIDEKTGLKVEVKGNPSKEFQDKVIEEIKKLPEAERKRFADYGGKIVIASKNSDAFPPSKSNQIPNPINNSSGDYNTAERTVIVSESKNSAPNPNPGAVLRYNLGSAINLSLYGASNTQEFQDAFAKDIAKLSPEDKKKYSYYLQPGANDGGVRSRGTAFSDIYAALQGNSAIGTSEETLKKFPNSAAEILRRLGDNNAEIKEPKIPDYTDKKTGLKIEFKGNTSQEFRNQVIEELKKIPEKDRKRFAEFGGKIVVAGMLSDVLTPEQMKQTPRGYKAPLDPNDIGGMHIDASTVVVAERINSGRNTNLDGLLRHELGHGLNSALDGFSNSDEFIKAYNKDRAKLSKEDQEKFAYLLQQDEDGSFEPGRDEAMAEIYAALDGKNTLGAATGKEIREKFPHTAALIRRRLNQK